MQLICGCSVLMQVNGRNLVPMTLQKQNIVTASLADTLAFAAVWNIRCIEVRQESLQSGLNTSSAVMSYVMQQDADALFVGQVGSPSCKPLACWSAVQVCMQSQQALPTS